jgi:hypothetical protein
VVHAVAVATTLETLRTHHATLFAPGRLSLYERQHQYNVVEGGRFSFDLKVRNIGRAAAALVGVGWKVTSEPLAGLAALGTSSGHRPAGGLEIDESTPRDFPDIQVGEIETIPITGIAAKRGGYRLTARGKIEAGWLRSSTDFGADVKVRVWPRIQHDQWVIDRCDEMSCWYRFMLTTGMRHDAGVGMEAILGGVDDAELAFVQGEQVRNVRPVEVVAKPGASVSGIKWDTYPLEAFRDVPFVLKVQGTARRTRDEWENLGRKIHIRNFPAEELKQ